MPPTRRRRVLAALLGTAAALLAGEVLARIIAPGYAERVARYEIEPVSAEPPSWVYRSGSTVSFAWDGDALGVLPPGARQTIAINPLGLRGEIPVTGRRIVAVGDSFTFGEGVADDATFCARLGLVNAGVAGHDTRAAAARVAALIDALRPAAILYVFVPNDAMAWDASAAAGGDLLNTPGDSWSRLVALIGAVGAEGRVEDWYRSHYVGEHAAAWRQARTALEAMSATCRSRGIPFGVAAFPLLHRLDAYPFAVIHEEVRAACEAAEIPFLDLAPTFAGRDARELWAHPADRHPNHRAHAVAAEALTPFVEGLLR